MRTKKITDLFTVPVFVIYDREGMPLPSEKRLYLLMNCLNNQELTGLSGPPSFHGTNVSAVIGI
jgi:hypothetical protein